METINRALCALCHACIIINRADAYESGSVDTRVRRQRLRCALGVDVAAAGDALAVRCLIVLSSLELQLCG